MDDVAILIPAYQPDENLVRLVGALRGMFAHVVVVDDGSTEGRAAFDAIRDHVEALLEHSANRGKGRALKTGIAWIREHLPQIGGVVTADADGQHEPDDILRIAQATVARRGGLVLGVRTFEGPVPFRSRWGNGWTRILFRLLTGLWIRDTQTGLRGIPADLLKRAGEIRGERYEYETRMLADARHHVLPPLQIPVKTVYIEGNRSSHYRPFLDTIRTQKALWFG